MKKYIKIILCIVLVSCLVSCDLSAIWNNLKGTTEETTTNTTTTTPPVYETVILEDLFDTNQIAKAIYVFTSADMSFSYTIVEMSDINEFFEVFTLMKTRKTARKIPTVLFGKKFWEDSINFETLINADVITRADMDFFVYADTVDEAFDYLKKELEVYMKSAGLI